MRQVLSQRHQAALLSGSAAFIFFSLAWYFAAHFTLGAAVGLALVMSIGIGMAFTRFGRGASRR